MRAWFLGLSVAACGTNEVDLTGIYQVTVAVGAAPCGTDQPVVGAPAYLSFHRQTLLGHDYFTYDSCADAAATNCVADGGLFAEPIDNGWSGPESGAAPFNGTCTLEYVDQTAILKAKQLVIEASSYSDAVALPDAQCTVQEAQKRGTSMSCVQHQHFEATAP